MKLINSLLFSLCVLSCREDKVASGSDQMDVNPSEIPENLRFSQVAVVQIDKSEEVCGYLRQQGIECYAEGSLAYALYVEDDRLEDALRLLKERKDWGDAVWLPERVSPKSGNALPVDLPDLLPK